MLNQRGEVVTGVMVVVMVVMMIFGGMHMMHGDHRSERGHAQIEHRHGHDENMRSMRDNDDGQADIRLQVEVK
jgi:hypothetical protein